MKGFKFYVLLFMAVGMLGISSCSVEEAPQRSITEVMADDLVFEEAIKASLDLMVTSQENDWAGNADEIRILLNNSIAGDDKADGELTTLLGMTRQAFLQQIESFALAINALNEKYPSINDMDNDARKALFASVIEQNENVQLYIANLQSDLNRCLAQDICTGIVGLAALIGGPLLCDVIANAIPVIGPLLCGIVIDLAEGLLNGVCGALPC